MDHKHLLPQLLDGAETELLLEIFHFIENIIVDRIETIMSTFDLNEISEIKRLKGILTTDFKLEDKQAREIIAEEVAKRLSADG